MPSWAEIKAVLDSPYVSADKKNRIMQAYDKDSFNFDDEQEEYAKKYLEGYADHDLDLNWEMGLGGDNGLQSAYDDAKADLDAGQAVEQQGSDAKDRAKSALDAMTAPASGGLGARNSNELLDQGKPACDFLCRWIDQIWNKRPSGGTLDYMSEIWGRYNRDRNIDFQKFLADADDLTNAHKINDDAMNAAKAELGVLFGEWQGQGATAARVGFEEKIEPDHRKLQDQIDGAAKLIPRTASAVFDAIKTKVDSVLGLYRTTVAHAPLEMANKVVKIARKETDSKQDLLDVAGWVDGVCGSNLSERLQSDDCGLNDENRDYAYDLCARWVANSFTPEFQGLLDAFDNHCETAQSTVEQQFGALADYLAGYHNEFTEPARTPRPASPVQGGGGGAGPGSGGGGGGASMPSAPAPQAEDPAAIADAAKKEGEQGINPITGRPLAIDPASGEPYPVDPKTGEAIEDAGRPETLTVQHGDNRIDMSEPDSSGRMDIKIDDGHGDARDFPLDWGDGAQHGVQDGTPAGQPAGTGAGQPAAPGGDQVPRTGDQPYTPGPDGKIHIQDGDLRITAERPQGPDGPTVVTVDDGTGTPTTYTLGEDAQPGGVTAEPAVGSPVPGGQQAGNGFAAPGGIDADHVLGGEGNGPAGQASSGTDAGDPGTGAGGTHVEASGVSANGTEAGDTGSDTGSGTDMSQQTTPASASGSLFSTPDEAGAGAIGGTLGESGFGSAAGDGGPLEAGALAGVSVEGGADQSVPAALGTAPPATNGPTPPEDHDWALGASGFGATPPDGMGMLGGTLGGADFEDDQERSSRAYRVDGGIFNTSGAGGRISGSLDDEDLGVRF